MWGIVIRSVASDFLVHQKHSTACEYEQYGSLAVSLVKLRSSATAFVVTKTLPGLMVAGSMFVAVTRNRHPLSAFR